MKAVLCKALASLSVAIISMSVWAQTAPGTPAQQDAPQREKATLGILPLTIGNSIEVNFGDIRITPEILENEFTGQIIEFLSKSRKFNLLERQRLRKVIDENKLTESDWVKPGEAARIGKLLVADYLAMGNIDRLSVVNRPVDIALTGEKSNNMSIVMKFGIRVVEVKSGSIVFAQTIEERVRTEDIRKEVSYSERKDWTWADYKDILFKRAAERAGNAILEGIYPVKVASVNGDEIILNRGQGAGVSVGDKFEIFTLGAEMFDPDTKESLGRQETKAGLLEVVSVKPKFSKAKALSSTGSIQPGSICRRVKPDAPAEAPVPYPRATPGW